MTRLHQLPGTFLCKFYSSFVLRSVSLPQPPPTLFRPKPLTIKHPPPTTVHRKQICFFEPQLLFFMTEEFWFDFRQDQKVCSRVGSFRTGTGVHTASYSMTTGSSFPWGQNFQSVKLTNQLRLVPRLRINGAIHSATHMHTTSWYGQRYIYHFVTCGWYRHNRIFNDLCLYLW